MYMACATVFDNFSSSPRPVLRVIAVYVHVSDAIHELGEPPLQKGRTMSINIQNNCEHDAINRWWMRYLTISRELCSLICQIMVEMLKNGFFVNCYYTGRIFRKIITSQKWVQVYKFCVYRILQAIATLYRGKWQNCIYFSLR